MKLLQIQKKNQVTLPAEVRKQLHLKEHDFLPLEIEGNRIILTPQKVICREQEWFWSKRWQEGEKEAERDIAEGRVATFDSADELMDDLNS